MKRNLSGAASTPINAAATTVSPDFSQYFSLRPAARTIAPIDEYYERVVELLTQASQSWCTDWHRQLLVVQLVATAELYVRSVLVGLVRICPSAARNAQRKQISLVSVDYYAASERAYAIFDHQALSGAQEIMRAAAQVVGIEIRPNTSVHAALLVFDRVCQLRHAIVHQTGRLAPHNILEFELTDMPSVPVAVAIDSIRFQELVAVCHSMVRSFNQHVFEQTISRWVRDDIMSLLWDRDKDRFGALYDFMHSAQDLPTATAESTYKSFSGAT